MQVTFLFYTFSSLILSSALFVIISKNSVYSVLWLIFCILNISGLFILLDAEFIAMSMIIIYVGAIAVLFLFIIKTSDTNVPIISRKKINHHYPTAAVIVTCLAINFLVVIFANKIVPSKHYLAAPEVQTNIHLIANVLYTVFALPFEVTGITLLVVTIGCVIITLSHKSESDKNTSSHNHEQNDYMHDSSRDMIISQEDANFLKKPELDEKTESF